MRNHKREFDELEKRILGTYIYCLRDPLNKNKIFYIGKGGGEGKGNDRVFSHFNEADKPESETDGHKLRTIRKIWAKNTDVDVYIIRRQIKTEEEAHSIEASLIDGLRLSLNGEPENPDGNKVSGHGKEKHGCMSLSEIVSEAAPDVNPKIEGEIRVFVFPIKNSIKSIASPSEEQLYDATRKAWLIKPPWLDHQVGNVPYYAVGIRNNVSLCAYRIRRWREWTDAPAEQTGKRSQKRYEFEGDQNDQIAINQLKLKNWKLVLEDLKDWLQWGGKSIPEIAFFGEGAYMHIRGRDDIKGVLQVIDKA